MSKPYTVKPGDTLSGIASRHGYKSWHEIYDSPENKPFRAKRPNPNLIFPGDVLLLPTAPPPPPVKSGAGVTLRRGDCGEEVRRLQHNLNEALGRRLGWLAEDGIFGPKTEQAVRTFQQLYRLQTVDGIVGPETRTALATRVLYIEGQITRTPTGPDKPSGPANPSPSPKPQPPQPADVPSKDSSNPSSDDSNKSAWLVQGQPAFIWTPPPWAFYDPKHGAKPDYSVYSGALQLGMVYQTAKEGPNWQFGGAGQFQFNSKKQPSDPRYTVQLQGQVSYADPFAVGRFHTAILAQVAGSYNIDPNFWTLGVGLGGQISVDIIKDHWNLFAQGVVAGQWTLNGPSSGQFLLLPQVTIGSTIQWEIGGN